MRASSSLCFNLRREAAPHATGSQIFCPFVFSIVSISDEKPLHMRRPGRVAKMDTMELFQSQTRSRSTCDGVSNDTPLYGYNVSISDEKPLHMRHSPGRRRNRARKVSISDEKPLHMRQSDFGQWHYG